MSPRSAGKKTRKDRFAAEVSRSDCTRFSVPPPRLVPVLVEGIKALNQGRMHHMHLQHPADSLMYGTARVGDTSKKSP